MENWENPPSLLWAYVYNKMLEVRTVYRMIVYYWYGDFRFNSALVLKCVFIIRVAFKKKHSVVDLISLNETLNTLDLDNLISLNETLNTPGLNG